MTKPRILGIPGSLRKDAFSTAVLYGLAQAASDLVDFNIHPLDAVPLYNQDLDTETPPAAVTALRDAITRADGVVIVSPEYNHAIPGMLKNALDWASRPFNRSAFIDKPTITATCSPGILGGVRAQRDLMTYMQAIPTRPVLVPQAIIGQAGQKITDGKLTDPEALTFLMANLKKMLEVIAAGR